MDEQETIPTPVEDTGTGGEITTSEDAPTAPEVAPEEVNPSDAPEDTASVVPVEVETDAISDVAPEDPIPVEEDPEPLPEGIDVIEDSGAAQANTTIIGTAMNGNGQMILEKALVING